MGSGGSSARVEGPVRPVKLSDQIVDRIGRRIATGPDAAQPLSELEVSTEFGVSRTVAREVLQTLAKLGMIEVAHGRRTRVRPPEEWDYLSPVVLRFHGGEAEVRRVMAELHETRLILEPEIAARAAVLATPEQLDRLRRCLELMEQAEDRPDDYLELDMAFHNELVTASANRVLVRIMDVNRSLLHGSRQLTNAIPRSLPVASRAHRQIFLAIEARNAGRARAEMYEHISFAAQAWTIEADG